MITQAPLRALFISPEPRRVRAGLSPLPALLLTEPTAMLEGSTKDLRTVADVLLMLIDGAAQFTDGDREMARRLFQVCCEE